MMMTSAMGVASMAAMGATTSLLAPGTVLAFRRRLPLRWSGGNPVATFTGFVLLHAGITLGMAADADPPVQVGLWLVLFAAGAIFWLPVLGQHSPLSEAGRCVYLFSAGPTLDLAAVFLIVVQGNQQGGLAMMVGMLPLGATAMAMTMRWARDEERAVTGLSPASRSSTDKRAAAHVGGVGS